MISFPEQNALEVYLGSSVFTAVLLSQNGSICKNIDPDFDL